MTKTHLIALVAILLAVQAAFGSNVPGVSVGHPLPTDTSPAAYCGQNPFFNSGYGGQCTAFCWGRAKEKLGISLPFRGNAQTWWSEAQGLYPTGSDAQANSIAVWSYAGLGHVAFVEEVVGDQVTLNEANVETYVNTNWGGGYDGLDATKTRSKATWAARNLGSLGTTQLLGYIYLDTVTPLPPPTLVAPGSGTAPGTPLSSYTPQFQWQQVTGADGYALYISKLQPDGTTYSLIFDSSTIGGPLIGTTYNLPTGYITSDGQYRWNMATHNTAGYGSPNASRYYFTESTVTPTRIISLSGNLAFGNVTVGSSPQSSFTIYNTGNSTLTVSSISYPSGFSGNWSGSIAAGGSHSVTVTFSPTSAISYGGTVTVNSDATSGTNTIAASGTGIPVPTRIISLSGIMAFGSLAVGSSEGALLTIYNNGNSTMTVSGISYPSGFSGSWSGTIAAGSSHSVTVTFAPTAVTSYGGTITVSSDATSGTGTITASGTGTAVATRIISLSGNLAFGNVTVGSSPQSSFTIYNTGNSTLTVSSISYPSGFSGNWSGTIAAGGSQSVTVTFSPSSAISYGGTVTVNSDETSGTNTINASGTGAPTPTRIISLSGNLAFGDVQVGQTLTRTLTISNSGNSTLAVSSISYPAGFSGAWSGTIPSGNSANIIVTFAPTAAISYGGTITVNSDKTIGTNTINASGTGIQQTTLISIEINGPLQVNENSSAPYACIAHYSDGNSSNVTDIATWSQNSSYAFISSTGYLTTLAVTSDQACTITATYSGQQDIYDITIKNLLPSTGGLQVTLIPEEAVTASAQWNVDGGDWQNSGEAVSDLTVGLHTVNYKQIPGWTAPESEQVTINNDQTTSIISPSYVQQSGNLTIKKCTVTAGKYEINDSIKLSGTIDIASADFSEANKFDVNIGGVYFEDINMSSFKAKNGKYTYTYRIPRYGQGGITSFVLDTNKHTFSLKAQKIDLTGLHCPFDVEIDIGNYRGISEVEEPIANGRRFMPVQLMSGVEDYLQVQSVKVKKGNLSDTLTIKGGIAYKILPTSMSDVILKLKGQTFTIPAKSFKPSGKSGLKYVCKNVIIAGGIASATFDFGKCTFSISIKNTKINSTTGVVDLTLAIGNFNEQVNFDLDTGQTIY